MRRAAPRAECKEREKIKLVHAQVIKASACTRAVTTHIFICHLMRGKKSIEPFILCARVRWNRITRWLQDWVASARKTRHFKGFFQRPGTKQRKKTEPRHLIRVRRVAWNSADRPKKGYHLFSLNQYTHIKSLAKRNKSATSRAKAAMNTFFRLGLGERKKLIFSLAPADSGIGSGQNFASLSVAPVRSHITLSLSLRLDYKAG
jgi:hypothetical protein